MSRLTPHQRGLLLRLANGGDLLFRPPAPFNERDYAIRMPNHWAHVRGRTACDMYRRGLLTDTGRTRSGTIGISEWPCWTISDAGRAALGIPVAS